MRLTLHPTTINSKNNSYVIFNCGQDNISWLSSAVLLRKLTFERLITYNLLFRKGGINYVRLKLYIITSCIMHQVTADRVRILLFKSHFLNTFYSLHSPLSSNHGHTRHRRESEQNCLCHKIPPMFQSHSKNNSHFTKSNLISI